jgi:hypothetical protein
MTNRLQYLQRLFPKRAPHRHSGNFLEIPITVIILMALGGLLYGVSYAARMKFGLGLTLLMGLGGALGAGLAAAALMLLCMLLEELVSRVEENSDDPSYAVWSVRGSRQTEGDVSLGRYLLVDSLLGLGLPVALWFGVLLIVIYPSTAVRASLETCLKFTLIGSTIFTVLAGVLAWCGNRFSRAGELPPGRNVDLYSLLYFALWPIGLTVYHATLSWPKGWQHIATTLALAIAAGALFGVGRFIVKARDHSERATTLTPSGESEV